MDLPYKVKRNFALSMQCKNLQAEWRYYKKYLTLEDRRVAIRLFIQIRYSF